MVCTVVFKNEDGVRAAYLSLWVALNLPHEVHATLVLIGISLHIIQLWTTHCRNCGVNVQR
jgi:hypothetical protein